MFPTLGGARGGTSHRETSRGGTIMTTHVFFAGNTGRFSRLKKGALFIPPQSHSLHLQTQQLIAPSPEEPAANP